MNAANARLRELNDTNNAEGKQGFFIQRELKQTKMVTETGEEKSVMAFAIQGDQVFPTLGHPPAAHRHPRPDRRLPAGRADEFAGLACSTPAPRSSPWTCTRKLRPGQSQKHLLMVGRIATTVVVGFGMIWIPVMKTNLGRRSLSIPAERAGLPRAADHRGVPARPVLEAHELRRGHLRPWAAASCSA